MDDESDTRIFLCNILGTCGFEPVDAADRTEGMQMARRTHPALIIIDAMMPKDDGIKMYHELKDDLWLRRVPVILVSTIDKRTFASYQRIQDRKERFEFPSPGAYLEIPLESKKLIELVRSLTDVDDCQQQ